MNRERRRGSALPRGALALLAASGCLAASLAAAPAQAAGAARPPASAKGGPGSPLGADLVVPEALRRQREAELGGTGNPFAWFGDPAALEAAGAWAPVEGSWADYEVHVKGRQVARLRISILRVLPDQRTWIELAGGGQDALPAAFRMRVRGHPARPESVERLQIYLPGQAPLELPLEDAREAIAHTRPKPEAPRIVRGPSETLTVQAGRFRCERVRLSHGKQSTTLWRSDQVPVFHIVQSRGEGGSVELVGHGLAGAHSLFPERHPIVDGQDPPAP